MSGDVRVIQGGGMMWRLSHRADRRALPLADRHYNRQKPGTPQFVPPGRCLVLLTPLADALWVSSWPFAEFVKHEWAGAWVCSCFRNESPDYLSSDLIAQAEAVTRSVWGDPPPIGMVSFIDRGKTRRKRDPGRCYLRAGWRYVGCHVFRPLTCQRCFDRGYPCGLTKGGLVVVRRWAEEAPSAALAAEDHPLFDMTPNRFGDI
jgi:uncharacterized protein YjhX (UPF0386 family)